MCDDLLKYMIAQGSIVHIILLTVVHICCSDLPQHVIYIQNQILKSKNLDGELIFLVAGELNAI